MVLNAFIQERYFAADSSTVEHPSEAKETCDLEDLSLEGLSKRDLLIRDILSKLLYCFLEVAVFLYIAERDAEGIDEHGDDTVMEIECLSDRVGEPADKITVEPDP